MRAHALEHDRHRVVAGFELARPPRPSGAASRRARSASAARSTPTRSSCPRRSGSSRSARRGGAPSTTRWSRASDARARSCRRRSRRTRASRRTSSGGRAGRARGSPCRRSSSGTTTSPSASSSCFRISATSIVCGHGTSGVGSRSKSTKSGRSGLSTREYHAFMSMQPMFTIQSSASSSFTSGKSIHLFVRSLSRVETLRVERRDPLGHVLRRVLLEERLAVRAVGIAAHRERPVLRGAARAPARRRGSSGAGRPS